MDPHTRRPVLQRETHKGVPLHQDIIPFSNFKRLKTGGKQKRPEPFLTPGENGDDNIVPLFSCLIQRRLSPNIRRNQKGSLNHDH